MSYPIDPNFNLVITAISLIFLALAWTMIWKKTALDECRDELFDLRDWTREWFIKNELPLDDRIYTALRDLLNSHIRHTEKISVTRYMIVSVGLQQDVEYRDRLLNSLQSAFATDDPKIRDFAKNVRENASVIITDYMMKTNFLMMALSFALAPFVLVWFAAKAIYKIWGDSRAFITLNVRRSAVLATIFTLVITYLPWQTIPNSSRMAKYFNSTRIEEYSLR